MGRNREGMGRNKREQLNNCEEKRGNHLLAPGSLTNIHLHIKQKIHSFMSLKCQCLRGNYCSQTHPNKL